MTALAASSSPCYKHSVGVRDPKKKISMACAIEKPAVIDKIILQPISTEAASNDSSIIITINTPTILPKLKNNPNIFLNYLGAISFR